MLYQSRLQNGDSWVTDITVRYDFLVLCDQRISYQHESYSQLLWCYDRITITMSLPLRNAHARYAAYNKYCICYCVVGDVNRFKVCLLHFLARYSQPSGEVRCCWGSYFRKPDFSKGQYKLKEISYMNFNLDIKFMRCNIYYFIPSLFNYSHLLFQISSIHSSVTVQSLAHTYINFLSLRPAKSSTVTSKTHKLPCVMYNVCACPSRRMLLLLYDTKLYAVVLVLSVYH
jgi:hypothetical protein